MVKNRGPIRITGVSVLVSSVLLIVASYGLSGCSSTDGTLQKAHGQSERNAEGSFVRSVEPFLVFDSSGVEYQLPMLGGFNVPRPQFADIDGDGDLDLFVQEETGSLVYLENTGTASEPVYTWRTDKYQDLDVGEWYRLFDLDADGDLDMLAEEQFSYVRYFRNNGSSTDPRFKLAVDTLRDATDTPLFADRQNIPNLVDIDCDGMVDLFIGRVTGTITRYESIGMDADNVPRFKFATDEFEDIQIIGELPGGSSRHGANTMTFADMDTDGDLDLFWGDYFEPGLLYIQNLGTCRLPSLRSEPVPFPRNAPVSTSGYNAPVIVDYDLDGDLDLFFGVLGGAFNANKSTVENLYFLEQIRTDVFEERTRRFVHTIDVGSESIVKAADFDGDGDLDLLITNKISPTDPNTSDVAYIENSGSETQPEFRFRGSWPLLSTYHQDPAIADLDGDGDLDMLLGKWNREIAYFRNDGSRTNPSFVLVDPVFLSLTRGSNSAPALADIDADGDQDLFVGEASGTVNYYENEGSETEARFVLVSDTFQDIDVGRRSFPTLADIDGDGDFDLLLGTELDGVLIYRNEGSPKIPKFVADGALDVRLQTLATPEFADLDGDGDLDLLVGGSSGGLLYFEFK